MPTGEGEGTCCAFKEAPRSGPVRASVTAQQRQRALCGSDAAARAHKRRENCKLSQLILVSFSISQTHSDETSRASTFAHLSPLAGGSKNSSGRCCRLRGCHGGGMWAVCQLRSAPQNQSKNLLS